MNLLTHLLFIWITITCSLVLLQHVTVAATTLTHSGAPAVGLYGPNRYDGIPDDCLLPMEFGYCRAKVKRYYFDVRRMKCAMFFWGGCAGNLNNFKTVDECNQVCLDGYEDIAQSNNAQVGQQQQQQPQQQQQRGNSNYNTNTRAGSTAAAPIAATSTGGINNSNSKYATATIDKGNFKSYLNKINNRSGDSINNANNNDNNSNPPNDSVYAASEDYDDDEEAETVE